MEEHKTVPVHLLADELAREDKAHLPVRKAPSEATVLQVGSLCDQRYLVIRPIAAGGMAEVYEVYDTLTRRPGAVKILQQRHVRKDFVVEKSIAEGRVMFETKHPGLVEVYGYGLHAGVYPYYVMELLEGETLHEKIYGPPGKPAAGPIPLAAVFDWMIELCEVVDYLHTEEEVIHRDLKPDNVFITAAGHVKGLDLSAAKLGRVGLPSTQTGRGFGTPHYMCPEHVQGTGKPHPTWDVYALGFILFEMLGRRYLFSDYPGQRHTNGELWAWHSNRERPSIRDVDPRLPVELDAIIQTAAAPSAHERFQSAAELMQALIGLRAVMRERGDWDRLTRPELKKSPAEIAAHRLALTTTSPTETAYSPSAVPPPPHVPPSVAPGGSPSAVPPPLYVAPSAAPLSSGEAMAPAPAVPGTLVLEGAPVQRPVLPFREPGAHARGAAGEEEPKPSSRPEARSPSGSGDDQEDEDARASAAEIYARVVAAPMRPKASSARAGEPREAGGTEPYPGKTAPPIGAPAHVAPVETVPQRPRRSTSEPPKAVAARSPSLVPAPPSRRPLFTRPLTTSARPAGRFNFAGGLAAGAVLTLLVAGGVRLPAWWRPAAMAEDVKATAATSPVGSPSAAVTAAVTAVAVPVPPLVSASGPVAPAGSDSPETPPSSSAAAPVPPAASEPAKAAKPAWKPRPSCANLPIYCDSAPARPKPRATAAPKVPPRKVNTDRILDD